MVTDVFHTIKIFIYGHKPPISLISQQPIYTVACLFILGCVLSIMRHLVLDYIFISLSGKKNGFGLTLSGRGPSLYPGIRF